VDGGDRRRVALGRNHGSLIQTERIVPSG
jgi:hypothetical protein